MPKNLEGVPRIERRLQTNVPQLGTFKVWSDKLVALPTEQNEQKVHTVLVKFQRHEGLLIQGLVFVFSSYGKQEKGFGISLQQ